MKQDTRHKVSRPSPAVSQYQLDAPVKQDTPLPSFELDLELIKTNILSKIHDDCLKNVTARVITRFYADLAR